MEHLDLAPSRRAAGLVKLPGSKSISNRTLLLAALARGATVLRGVLDSDDTRVMRAALAALGVPVEEIEGPQHVRVQGVAGASFPAKRSAIFLGNSGTSARSLAAVLALSDGEYELSGVARMHERPIGDLVDALRQAGARIRYLGREGFPPLAIAPREPVEAPRIAIRGNVSSQFLSGVLMALPAAGLAARVDIVGELISKPYVDLTLGLMERFGARVERDGWKSFDLPGGAGYVSPGEVEVEGDASSASYFMAAGTLGGGPVRMEGVGRSSAQGDVHFYRVVAAMGARVEFGDTWIEVAGRPPLEPFDLDFNLIPDAAMTAAVLALFAKGPCTLRNIGSWRVKETDRIAAMATELRKFGAQVEEGADSLRITPPPGFLDPAAPAGSPVVVDTYDDHRMAMCFSLASFGPRPVRINDPRCVAKTFPEYFEVFRALVK
ncbi:MAG TPA: 3-phosphoshikimate 1-carboxyvinyltransferase [Usitatibacter sp.]|jgi:3-phosphoshikimate 1-carboxyvinyltransferase|nr:3-phosphoshikimate 1-carboxyvinyltransferase [Usitatibacter sp.]